MQDEILSKTKRKQEMHELQALGVALVGLSDAHLERMALPEAIEALAVRLRAGSQIVLRGSRHEILQERDSIREQFWAAFDAFVPGVAMSKAS